MFFRSYSVRIVTMPLIFGGLRNLFWNFHLKKTFFLQRILNVFKIISPVFFVKINDREIFNDMDYRVRVLVSPPSNSKKFTRPEKSFDVCAKRHVGNSFFLEIRLRKCISGQFWKVINQGKH
jgi:hypothetical protein